MSLLLSRRNALKTSLIALAELTLPLGTVRTLAKESTPTTMSSLSPEEAQQIAKQAYIYAYPMLENYRTALITLDKLSPKFWAPLNHFYHVQNLSTPEYNTVIVTNNDTLYSRAWLDLRTEPIVLSVPATKRFYTIQPVDMYTHNFAYIGTRATGTDAGHYMFAGPNWKGPKPAGINAVLQSEGQFVVIFSRTLVYKKDPEDLPKARAQQRQYKLTPLSSFLGRAAIPQLPLPPYPEYDEKEVRSAGFIRYLNFLLGQVEPVPDERELLAQFSRIGIGPNRPFNSEALIPKIRNAMDRGVEAAHEQIKGEREHLGDARRNGWQLMYNTWGTRKVMQSRYLQRANAAMYGIYANSFEEAFYPVAFTDPAGKPLDGSKHTYAMHLRKEEIPSVHGFWSLTPYYWPQETLVANPIQRYSVGDRTPGVEYGADGSLTIHLQYESPGPARESNWLPIPNGPFFLVWRLYWGRQPADRQWAPPPLAVGELPKMPIRTRRSP